MSSRRTKITLAPEVLRWARERASLSLQDLAGKVNVKPETVEGWESTGKISFAQIDKLADRTHTPSGFLFLSKPLDESLPMTDYRTGSNSQSPRPSPNLLDTVYQMQSRQSWMRCEVFCRGSEPLDLVGKCGLDTNPQHAAQVMRDFLGLPESLADAAEAGEYALEVLRDLAEEAGVMVAFSGIVGGRTDRKLDPAEFQGIALVDEYAPLVFINASDFKEAQIYTLVHELAHLLVGESGLCSFGNLVPSDHEVERFCHEVAMEFLVPEQHLRDFWPTAASQPDPFKSAAQRFKVGSLVCARRAKDLDLIDEEAFAHAMDTFKAGEAKRRASRSNDDFWMHPKWQLGTDFATSVVWAAEGGRLPYREAYNLTEIYGGNLDDLVDVLGIQL